jgi:SagB-type dehydrogenase family enzyme
MSPAPEGHEPRLLALRTPRRDGDAVVFVRGDEEIRVSGDAAFVLEVLERCDGSLTADELVEAMGGSGDDTRALLDLLVAEGVVGDISDAWRTYHEASSVDSGLFRAVSDEAVARLRTWAYAPPGDQVTEQVSLAPRASTVRDLGGRRQSAFSQDGRRPVDFEELSTVLAAMYEATPGNRRPVPSAGGMQPLIIHVLVRNPVGPLDAGLWWYDGRRNTLLRTAEAPGSIDELFVPYPVDGPILAAGHPVISISADLERPSMKYASRSYRFALMECGAVMQNAYLVCTELDVPIRAVGGIADRAMGRYLDLPADAVPLLALVLGA